jgi:hypothetical protein
MNYREWLVSEGCQFAALRGFARFYVGFPAPKIRQFLRKSTKYLLVQESG